MKKVKYLNRNLTTKIACEYPVDILMNFIALPHIDKFIHPKIFR
jgi:hypothetical protein